MSHEYSPDAIATCPFDPNHKVAAHKIQAHIVKCKRSHPELERQFVQCPFNASHLIPSSEKDKHILSCIDRERVLSRKPQPTVKLEVPVYDNYVHNPDDEDWDRDNDIDVLKPVLGQKSTLSQVGSPTHSQSSQSSHSSRETWSRENKFKKHDSETHASSDNESYHKVSRGRGIMLKMNEKNPNKKYFSPY
ncbi:unnamed protein product [Brachionus calyciflorus]|uniref:CHHC U11-48K-type domain-containing protein n=1 Tax=Brachionus calyciflorus TaxID=104777 RepID=A0A813QSS2_9BILA|nr:unnamed protein product [Brachionus calyciflorus]